MAQNQRAGTRVAVFEPRSGTGSVCGCLQSSPSDEGALLLIDAPGIYRKVAAYCLVDRILATGFVGTYRSAVGFFHSGESNREDQAQRHAQKLQVAGGRLAGDHPPARVTK